jgi:UDP-glucose 4-epimerase
VKIAIESLIMSMSNSFGVATTILRLTNPYGPWQRADFGQGVLGYWLKALCEGIPLQIYGTGSTIRSFIYIDDFCDAVMSILERRSQCFAIYNIGGYIVSLSDLYVALAHASVSLGLGVPACVHLQADDLYDHIEVDCSRDLKAFGTLALMPLADGLLQSLR